MRSAADGSLHGTTRDGGSSGPGTVFRLDAAGTLTTLHSFNGVTDGAAPWAPLVQAADGSFYGTTSAGGAADGGTLFRLALFVPEPPRHLKADSGDSQVSLVGQAPCLGAWTHRRDSRLALASDNRREQSCSSSGCNELYAGGPEVTT